MRTPRYPPEPVAPRGGQAGGPRPQPRRASRRPRTAGRGAPAPEELRRPAGPVPLVARPEVQLGPGPRQRRFVALRGGGVGWAIVVRQGARRGRGGGRWWSGRPLGCCEGGGRFLLGE